MKRLICLVSILFILTGCTAEYRLKIDDDFDESILYYVGDGEDLYQYRNNNIPLYYDELPPSEVTEKVEGIHYYDYVDVTSDKSVTKSSHRFLDISELSRGFITTSCIGSIDYTMNSSDNTVDISTLNKFKCFEVFPNLDTVSIKIELADKYEVVETNATRNENNTLMWYFNKSNPNNCSIHLKYKDKSGSTITEDNTNREEKFF